MPSLFERGFIAFVFWFVFGDILVIDWVSPVSNRSRADKNVKTGFLGVLGINTPHAYMLLLEGNTHSKWLQIAIFLFVTYIYKILINIYMPDWWTDC